jgi:CRP-like cAMP-binding protein
MTVEPDFWEVSWRFDGEPFESLSKVCDEQTFAADELIFKQGDTADCMYLVLDGYAVAVITDRKTGAERGVSIIAEGQSFGEVGLLMKQRRTGTVTAGTDLKVLKITQSALKKLEQKQPASAMTLYKKLARTLAEQILTFEEGRK